MKYTDTQIGFQEFPDEISLLINISNCPFHCPGCHSPELWEDVGTELNYDEVEKLINVYYENCLVGEFKADIVVEGVLILELKESIKIAQEQSKCGN